MNGWQEAVASLCAVAVVGSVIKILLPDNSLGKGMRSVVNLLVAAVIINAIISLCGISFDGYEYEFPMTSDEAEDYLTDRTVESLTDEIEASVESILHQFGIKHGQISIDFNKGRYSDVTLKHISVYIPKEHAADRQLIKKTLLEKFDVFCDVSALP